MKKLLNYFQFISERKSDDSKVNLEQDQTEDIFQMLQDDDYEVSLEEHHISKSDVDEIVSDGEMDADAGERIFTDRDYYDVYSINIRSGKFDNIESDITDEYNIAMDVIKSMGFTVLDPQGVDKDPQLEMFKNLSERWSYKDVYLIDGKIHLFKAVTGRSIQEVLDSEVEKGEMLDADVQDITIYISDMKPHRWTSKELAEEFNWHYDGVIEEMQYNGKPIKDVIYFDIDREALSDIVMSRNSWGKEYLEWDGLDKLYDQHLHNDYTPDIRSMFMYSLDDENAKMLVKCVIMEHGGPKELIEEYDIDTEAETMDELIEFLLGERYYENLESIDSEIIDEIGRIIEGHERNAHVDEIYQEIENEFDNLLDSQNVEYIKKFRATDTHISYTRTYDGKSKRQEIEYETWMYRIIYEDRYFDDSHSSMKDMEGWSLSEIFNEYYSDNYLSGDISIRDVYGGDVDNNNMNAEIKTELVSYIERNSK